MGPVGGFSPHKIDIPFFIFFCIFCIFPVQCTQGLPIPFNVNTPPPPLRHWGLKTIKLGMARSCPHPLTMPWPEGHLYRKHETPLPAPSNGKPPQGAQGSLPLFWPMKEGFKNTSWKWCQFPPIGADESLLGQSEELPIWSHNFRDHSRPRDHGTYIKSP
jgi:hypothetical protein